MNSLSNNILQSICNKLFHYDVVKLQCIFDIVDIAKTRSPVYVYLNDIDHLFYLRDRNLRIDRDAAHYFSDNPNHCRYDRCLDNHILFTMYPYTIINDVVLNWSHTNINSYNGFDYHHNMCDGYTLYCYENKSMYGIRYNYVLVPDTNKKIIYDTKQNPVKKIKLIKI